MRILAVTAILAFFGAAALAGGAQHLDPHSVCPSIWRPVCAVKDGDSRTFANACIASRQEFAVRSKGACGGSSGLLPSQEMAIAALRSDGR
jgi:hypothetical protein